jgi:hypothetical protein
MFFLAPDCSSRFPGVLGAEVDDAGWFLETLLYVMALLGY